MWVFDLAISIMVLDAKKPVVNPAPQAKLDLYLDKRTELESVLQIKQKSDELKKSSNDLNEAIKILSESAKSVGDILANWEGVFNVMGDSNIGKMKTTDKWVRYVRPNDNEGSESIAEKRRY
ncbi:hypothetical protein INT48_003157 [Thamnidium elegans]|uniref:Outer kinetochore protein DAD2 n=1 Tax=Thamnidium elegans TaxID=101142 RepID=A0A8H7SEI2_9FUNG|nr:hypothetical protein INT48_003157 [Thamnidium elegans]